MKMDILETSKRWKLDLNHISFCLLFNLLDLQFLFKKYLEYEKSVGDEERIESVKQKALEYVESTLA